MNTQLFPQPHTAEEDPASLSENCEAGLLLKEGENSEEQEGARLAPFASPLRLYELSHMQTSFEDHSKIETLTPTESLLDFPLPADSPPRFSSPPAEQLERERQLLEEASYLREENLFLREELEEMRAGFQQMAQAQQAAQPVYSSADVNRLIEENRSLEESAQRLAAERNALRREIAGFEQNLLEISASNQELYKKVVSLTNELERERRDARTALRESEERFSRGVELEQQRSASLAEELACEREESENLRAILDESNQEIDRLNSLRGRLEEECEALINEKQELKECIGSLQGEQLQDEINEIREAIESKREENEQLKVQLQNMEEEYHSLLDECAGLKDLYDQELLASEQSQEAIANLKQQLQKAKRQERAAFAHPFPSTAHNNYPRRMHKPDPNTTCSASTAHRLKVLCNDSTRKSILQELKRLIKDIARVDLENKITSLLHELYMDAEYRERTNMQMQEMIVQLEAKIAQLERRPDPARKPEGRHHSNGNSESYTLHLEESLSRYERLLLNADSEKLQLMDEVSALKKENYQVRLELANSQLDTETQELIEQLTLQLEQEKHSSKSLQEENELYREEIVAIQRELHDKNKRIKLLMLNLNKRQEEGRI